MRRSDAGETLTNLILEVFRMNGELLSIGNELTKPFNLTSARWQILGPIAEELLTVSQIARRMGLARQGVQRIVNDLEKLGLVKLKSNMDHKNSPLIALTKEGEKVMAQVDEAQAKWVNKVSEELDEQEIGNALNVIEVIRKRIEQM